jgi:ABC-type antimicrobial peptide transport system permease subunit
MLRGDLFRRDRRGCVGTVAWPAALLIAVMLAASAIPAARAGRVNLLQLLKEN